jgi:hypothetical protein
VNWKRGAGAGIYTAATNRLTVEQQLLTFESCRADASRVQGTNPASDVWGDKRWDPAVIYETNRDARGSPGRRRPR